MPDMQYASIEVATQVESDVGLALANSILKV